MTIYYFDDCDMPPTSGEFITYPSFVQPPHSERNAKKTAAITRSIKQNGWQGRPLLVVKTGERFAALTGSHRLASAKKAGLEEVPCYVINHAKFSAKYDASFGPNGNLLLRGKQGSNAPGAVFANFDAELMDVLEDIGDAQALKLMNEEINA